MTSPRSEGQRRVLVVGAGRRARNDLLPALSHLRDHYEIVGVAARSQREFEASGRTYQVRELSTVTASELSEIDLVAVCVTKGAVPGVLETLVSLGAGGVDLLVDTPVVRPTDLDRARCLAEFRNAWVAEDCSTLPWLDTVAKAVATGLIGQPTTVRFDRAAYRYHGVAIMRSIFGSRLVRARRRKLDGAEHTEYRFSGGRTGISVEPRDYASGYLTIEAGDAVITSTATGGEMTGGAAARELRLELRLDGERCAGFRLGDVETYLSAAESAALGPVRPGDTIISRMDDLKRIGLMRMLDDLGSGRGGYPIDDGLEDMFVDAALALTGWWATSPLTSIRSSRSRRFYGGLTGLTRRVRLRGR